MVLVRVPILALIWLAAANVAAATSLAASNPQQIIHLGLPSAAYPFEVYSNQALTDSAAMQKITRVVLVLHGVNRDADRYFADTLTLLKQSGDAAGTLIIAPKFYNHEDRDVATMPPQLPYWTSNGWSIGLPTNKKAAKQIASSFAVLDDVLLKLGDQNQFPNLRHIVMAGHSAGGQMLQRYAALNNQYERTRAGLSLEYAIANPGTYMYFDKDRPLGDVSQGATAFAPYTGPVADFNQYKYGLDFSGVEFKYPLTLSPMQLFARFATRQVSYFAGSLDTQIEGPLDQAAPANLSGLARLQRAMSNCNYEKAQGKKYKLSAQLEAAHRYYLVQGVGHNAAGMWGSQCAMPLLFGRGVQNVGQNAARCESLEALTFP